jgi:hypothetical protein
MSDEEIAARVDLRPGDLPPGPPLGCLIQRDDRRQQSEHHGPWSASAFASYVEGRIRCSPRVLAGACRFILTGWLSLSSGDTPIGPASSHTWLPTSPPVRRSTTPEETVSHQQQPGGQAEPPPTQPAAEAGASLIGERRRDAPRGAGRGGGVRARQSGPNSRPGSECRDLDDLVLAVTLDQSVSFCHRGLHSPRLYGIALALVTK